MEYLLHFVDFFLHLDVHLDELVTQYGSGTYAVLFLIVFCETGLVVTPILPGDSLLFAAGAIAARGTLSVPKLTLLLAVAAILGDALNYFIGHTLGPRWLAKKNSRILKPEYLERTHRFFEKYGAKTIIFARFVPIVRTFAPFLAGVGTMTYAKFATYNIVGGILWVSLFIGAGSVFGDIPVVRKNFTLVIFGIIFVSILPGIIEFVRTRRAVPKDEAPTRSSTVSTDSARTERAQKKINGA